MLDGIKPFIFHGVDFDEKTIDLKQAAGTCPFCDDVNHHFFVNQETRQWDCKKCGRDGNLYTFLQNIYDKCWSETPNSAYIQVAKARGIPAKTYEEWGLVLDYKNRWLLPSYNPEGSLVNLHVWFPGRETIGTPACSLHLIGGESIKNSQTVYLCEGHWDTYALEWLRQAVNAPGVVVGVPGAAVFKKEWVDLFKGRDVSLLYDNDTPGIDGQSKVLRILEPVARSLRTIRWPSDCPEHFDINDFVRQGFSKPIQTWKLLENLLTVPSSSQRKHGRKVPTFAVVLKEYRKYLHLDKKMSEALAIIFSVIFSLNLPGDPLWLFLVGPPGAGKTLMLRSLEDAPQCVFQSSLSTTSLVSGFRSPGGEDSSLIPLLKDKVLVLKDYTEVICLPTMVQEQIYGTLRGAYDGRVERHYGNQIDRVYEDCYFSMVAGVTDVIHGDERATLGERFLKCQFLAEDHNPEKHIRAALSGMDESRKREEKLRGIAAQFLDRHLEPADFPDAPGWLENRIVALTQIIAFLRTNVHRSYRGEISYRLHQEVGTRLAKQLVKLGRSLAVVYGKKAVDMDCYRIVERVALDTATGWFLDITRILVSHYPKGLTHEEIAHKADIPGTSLQRKLDDLMALKVVIRGGVKDSSKQGRGRPPFSYTVSKSFEILWRAAKINQ